MAVNVLEQLLVHIQRLTAQDLQCLANIPNTDWLTRLRNLQPEVAAQEIRRILEASSSVFVRLERVALLYCWLMKNRKIGPWLLLRFGPSALQADCKVLLENVERAFLFVGRPAPLYMTKDGATYYSCMIHNYSDPTARKWAVVFVVLWSGQRFAAAYVGTNDQQRTLMTCFHIALRGESVELLRGIHANLDAAFRAGVRDVGATVSLRLDRDPSIAARFLAE